MIKRKALLQHQSTFSSHALPGRRRVALLLFGGLGILVMAQAVAAVPLTDYHQRIRQTVTALDSLVLADESEDPWAYERRRAETIGSIRILLPPTDTVEWKGATFSVDHSWLHQELDKFATAPNAERARVLNRVTERLQAIHDRIAELGRPGSEVMGDKADARRRLAEILQRAEYARTVKRENALSRLMDQFLEWLRNLLPTPAPVSPGSVSVISKAAQIFVIALALGVLAFVLKLFLPRMLRSRKPKQKKKAKARIVLGERLEPDQSALDLLSEAEALARGGELRAAIRKAYIALLVELGERKIISLAQHKTNRDYLRAVRGVEPLYGRVKQLTDSFERHWYGLAQATESDWLAFRSTYK
ncbi:MAG: DUF4129 domain-containing protein, partial [Acidobacteria bacterium]|nr:DUF4129 domain-containing protein [Acidobacteriota bacterium]